jgi:peptide-methionine (S)-S-oxide reductase
MAAGALLTMAGCAQESAMPSTFIPPVPPAGHEMATFAAGCFWCIEEIFRQQPGVHSVVSGYTGGTTESPTYAQVCSGRTGHAEAVQVRFDPNVISYEALLNLFWQSHDPTQLNRQGADVGTQYRSAIFVHSDAQRAAARASRDAEQASGRHAGPLVTTFEPAAVFHPAEPYHQEYYRNNSSQSYCRLVIRPKLEKLGLEP